MCVHALMMTVVDTCVHCVGPQGAIAYGRTQQKAWDCAKMPESGRDTCDNGHLSILPLKLIMAVMISCHVYRNVSARVLQQSEKCQRVG